MYECGCKNGFVLSSDGYNCIIQGKLQQKKNRYVTRINIFAFNANHERPYANKML